MLVCLISVVDYGSLAITPTGLPAMAAFGIVMVITGLVQERHDRARHAEVFATLAPAIDGEVVASDRLEGHWSTYSVEVGQEGFSMSGARHRVTLQVVSGDWAWSLRHGRRPAAWRSKEWYVKSRNPAVAESLESLGAPTLMAHRYCHGDQPFSAELEPPTSSFD